MNPPNLDVAALREEYCRRRLRRRDLDPDPIVQFSRWLAEAVESRIKDANAMSLATVNAAGQPSARMVLLKGVNARGFLFFTNYGSRKAADLEANPRAGLNFFWAELERQVAIEGNVRKASREEAAGYFHSRPRGVNWAHGRPNRVKLSHPANGSKRSWMVLPKNTRARKFRCRISGAGTGWRRPASNFGRGRQPYSRSSPLSARGRYLAD